MDIHSDPPAASGHGRAVEPASRGRFFRHPPFWVGLSLLAAVAVLFAVRFFPAAFPVVGLELAMDRESALEAAWELATEHGWVSEDHRQAASFREPNREARTYLELELGIDDAFSHLVEVADFHPYRWQVRHFREGERTEATVRFTPDGSPYGFTLELPEDEPGAALPPDEARRLAEANVEVWGVGLERFELVESSQETRAGGRVDHTFVYRMEGVELGEAEARLRLRVAGDRPSEVHRLIRVPEGFSRRWEELRSANETVALAASMVFLLLFGLAGCGGGIFYLLRRNALVWKPALAWGLVVGGLTGLAVLSSLPLAWMGYDTAVSRGLFLTQQWLAAVGILLGGGLVLAIIFAAGEGLTRRAMPTEPRLWKLWSPGVANTRSVLGRTLGGYLLAAIEVGFVVAFYLFAVRRDGWWVPSEALVQPDLVATYLPALTAISASLMAGFWEEALFRGVPLAVAILVGRRFGWKGLLVAAALVLQALVFAAAHADYPQQPSYARVLELVVPATLWGLVYLRFGLLPVILAHALYNLTWFSLPIFVAPAGLWLDRTLLVAAALFPLAVVLYRIRQHGLVDDVPVEALNRTGTADAGGPGSSAGTTGEDASSPGSAVSESSEAPDDGEDAAPGSEADGEEAGLEEPMAPGAARRIRAAVALAGGVGAILWLLLTPFSPDVPTLTTDRDAAVESARERLLAEGISLDEPWRPLAWVQGAPGPAHRFVWREGGPDAYRTLLEEGHLRGPSWQVRFVRFTGTVEERAEEFRVGVGPGGNAFRRQHLLPEDRPGAELGEDEARALVLAEAESVLGLDPGRLEEVSAEASREPARVDWTFTFSRPEIHPMEWGEARVEVSLAGERPSDGVRFVHVPEEWQRMERERGTRSSLLGMVSGLMLVTLLGGAAVVGLVRWARGRGAFATGAFWGMGALLLGASVVSAWLRWPLSVAGFGTAQPYRDQVFIELGVMVMGLPVLALAGGLAAGAVHGAWGRRGRPGGERTPAEEEARSVRETGGGSNPSADRWGVVGWGLLLGLALAGAQALGRVVFPPGAPVWFQSTPAGFRWSWMGDAPGAISSLVFQGLLLLLVVLILSRLTRGWQAEHLRGAGVALAGGLAWAGGLSGLGVVPWLVGAGVGALALAALVPVVRALHLAAIPLMVAVPLVLPPLRNGIVGSYPGALTGGLVTAVVALGAAAVWAWSLTGLRGDSPSAGGSP